MAQRSKPRHSRTTRKPVTIDLEPGAVSENVTEPEKEKDAVTEPSKPETAAKGPPAGEKTEDTGEKTDDSGAEKPDQQQKGKTDATVSAPDTAANTQESQNSGDGDKKTGEGGKMQDSAAIETEVGSTPPPNAMEPQAAGSGSTMRIFTAAVAAAIIAVVLFGGLQWAGILPVPGGDSADRSVESVVVADVDALKRAVAALENEAVGTADAAREALGRRIDALEAAAPVLAGTADADGRVSDLESKLAALESRLADIGTGSDDGNSVLADTSQKITAVENSLSGQQITLQQLQSSVSDLDSRIAADATSRGQSIKDIETRLAAIEQQLAAPRQDLRVARALAAASLKAAIDRGDSFMAELAAYESTGGDSSAVSGLQPFAADGVPSRATLLAQFPAIANEMIDAGQGDAETGGVFGRLWGSASSLVRIRPVGDVTGDGVDAIVARMESDLEVGNLQGAVDQWNTLPQTSKDVSQDYVADLKARIEAEALVSGTLTAAQAAPADTTQAGTAQTEEQN